MHKCRKNDECVFTIWRKRKAKEDMTRNEQKRVDIIEGARLTFLEKGFEQASMDDIAKRAGVSKRTVYANFGSKEELFSGLMDQVCKSKRDEVQLAINPELDIEDALIDLGERFLSMIFEQEGVILFRMLIGNATAFPDIGEQFFNQGPKEVSEEVAAYLQDSADRGLIEIEDAQISAEALLASMFGAQQIRMLITNTPPPDAARRSAMVKTAVSQFLKGVRKI